MDDTTRHRRHPEGPASSEEDELLRLATEAAGIGLWDYNLVAQRLFWPARVKAMFGMAADAEPTIEDFYGGLHPEDREAVLGAFAAAQDPDIRAIYEVEYRTIGKDDQAVRWVAAKGRGVFDEDGRCTRVLGSAVDITRRKEASTEQRASEERLALLGRIGEATRVLNDGGEVMQVTARLLGEHLQATRCAYADVEPDGDRFTIRNDWSLAGVPSSAGAYSLDLFGPQATSNLRQGRHLVVNDVDRELGDEGGARMFNAIGIKAIICAGLVKHGRLVAMMAVHQATPRTWTAQDVHLVAEVVDRCWAHIERVRDAAMLREQDRRKDEFLATLAHELRNPVAPLRYAATLLKLVDDPARQRHAREVIERQAGHLARLIDDLLDISRINRGLIELKREVVSVASLLQQAVEASGPGIQRARHRLTLQLPSPDVCIDADPARIVQAITNLLDNAAKYTPDGGDIRLTAWVHAGQVLIEVVDNGIGIPPQEQGKLFQLFTQLPHHGHRAQGGLGIGLSLVKRLIEMHAGRVRLNSAGLDEGSTFTLELPVCPPPSVAQADETARRPVGTGRVLVVEDNEDGLQILMTLLEAAGHEVRGASNGEQALDVVANWLPQLVLLDIGLPRMDGYQVATRMRSDVRMGGVRLVALTGWGAQRDRARTTQAGFDAHLTKPVEPEALLQLLAEWFQAEAAH